MNRRFRIAMMAACPLPASRGTPIRILRLAEELQRRDNHVDVFAYHLGEYERDVSFRIRRIADIKTYRKQSPGPSYQKLMILDPLLAASLFRANRTERYDVVHAHHVEGILTALPSRSFFGTPVVFDMHTLLESELPYYRLGLPKRFLKMIGRKIDSSLPKRADHVIAVSEQIKTKLLRNSGILERDISVIPNGLEPDFCVQPEYDTEKMGPDSAVLAYAGNFAPYQGIENLLRSFAKALKRQPRMVLRLISESSFAAYESLAAELEIRDHIELVKADLNDLPNQLGQAAVALNPRIECDGMPQKLLNYMGAACPIISFASSAKHLVHDENALIVADHDLDGFADAIIRLVSNIDLQKRLGGNGRDFVERELSWARTARRAEDVYARLV